MNSPSIMRSDDLRAENLHRIIRTLRTQGSLTRADISNQTGLSQAALSTLFGLLTEQGVVTSENKNEKTLKPGRPKTTVTLDPSAALVVTIALTIDHLSFTLVDYAGTVNNRIDQPLDTQSLNKKQLFDTIVKGVKATLKPHDTGRLKAISIGFQGLTDVAAGAMLWSPILHMEKVPIGSMLKAVFGVPVSVNNDCSLIAKALHQSEKKKMGESFAAVLFSHGIGLGVYLSGKPFAGAHTSALELGHIQFVKDGALCRCGKLGCIEAYAANYGILRSANKLAPSTILTGKVTDQQMEQLISAAHDNHQPAIDAFNLAGKAIGFGLATMFTLLDPIPVALVGHNSDAIALMRSEIEQALTSVGRSPSDYSSLLHCFHEDLPLLQDGLVLEAMSVVDRLFAEISSAAELETSY